MKVNSWYKSEMIDYQITFNTSKLILYLDEIFTWGISLKSKCTCMLGAVQFMISDNVFHTKWSC